MRSVSPAEHGILRFHRALRPGFGTEAAVYGTILVSGLIAVTSSYNENSTLVLIKVGATVVIFWGAHVYAGTVARLGSHRVGSDARVGLRAALRTSMRESLGLLTSTALPALVLLAGAVGLFPDELANDLALWAGVLILAFLGYVAFLLRGSSLWIRIVGALATASFGLAFVGLKAFVH